MTQRTEVITWLNADQMHWEIMLRASLLAGRGLYGSVAT